MTTPPSIRSTASLARLQAELAARCPAAGRDARLGFLAALGCRPVVAREALAVWNGDVFPSPALLSALRRAWGQDVIERILTEER